VIWSVVFYPQFAAGSGAFTEYRRVYPMIAGLAVAAGAACALALRRVARSLPWRARFGAAWGMVLVGAAGFSVWTGQHTRYAALLRDGLPALRPVSAEERACASLVPRRVAHVRRAMAAGRDLRCSDLRWQDLSGEDLRRADLRGSRLSFARLRRASLSGADLGGAFAPWLDLGNADLQGATLDSAYLLNSVLALADLRGGSLRRSHLAGVDLSGADLRGTDLRGANLYDVPLRDAKMEGARICLLFRPIVEGQQRTRGAPTWEECR
jgi:hypothetical protein